MLGDAAGRHFAIYARSHVPLSLTPSLQRTASKRRFFSRATSFTRILLCRCDIASFIFLTFRRHVAVGISLAYEMLMYDTSLPQIPQDDAAHRHRYRHVYIVAILEMMNIAPC